jgi:hypothetical protein
MKEKLLRVESPYYVAGAVWEKKNGEWTCVRAAGIIKWMIGKDPVEVKRYLDSKGFRYTWL